jgi:hypothetical protein
MPEPHYTIPELLRKQSWWCERLGSPFYAYLLEQSACDFEASGPAKSLLAKHEFDPPKSALALRFMGSVHRLVLAGTAPHLAKYYPSAGGAADESAWTAFRNVLAKQQETLRPLVKRPVQTNEVARCGALLPGFIEIASQTKVPLRLLELGASAGLNLRWDQYRYEYSSGDWGPIDSPVQILDAQSSGRLHLDLAPKISTRSGCDIHPVDPTTKDGQLTLQSYVWADQIRRHELLRSALEVAQNVSCEVQHAHAGEWIPRQLNVETRGVCSTIFHSIVLQYLSEEERERVTAAIRLAGEAASDVSPLAWLRMEPGSDQTEIRLQVWPKGIDRVIATAGYHGSGVRWLG